MSLQEDENIQPATPAPALKREETGQPAAPATALKREETGQIQATSYLCPVCKKKRATVDNKMIWPAAYHQFPPGRTDEEKSQSNKT